MKVMQIGLGRIGAAVTRLLLDKLDWRIVAAVDTDPAKQGRDVGHVVGLERALGIVVRDTLPDVLDDIDIAFLTTVSSLADIFPTLQGLIHGGIDVVSSSEELFYPYHRHAEQALTLDHLAKQHHVSILGTGLMPGFIMDTLVLLLTVVCHDITRIAVTRIINVSDSRPSLHKQIGLGLTPDIFAAQVPASCWRARGHRFAGIPGPCFTLAYGRLP
jgi:4-hydroxy-tetrahydrodipicolinate reductase